MTKVLVPLLETAVWKFSTDTARLLVYYNWLNGINNSQMVTLELGFDF